MLPSKTLPPGNPFVAARLAPGELPYLPTESCRVEEAASRFQAFGRRGQILGGHGTGKSTLVAALRRRWTDERVPTSTVQVTEDSQTHWQAVLAAWNSPQKNILIVDGFDLLPSWRQVLVRLGACRRKTGLLVTTHRPLGLPTIAHTKVTSDIAHQVIQLLVEHHRSSEGTRSDWPIPVPAEIQGLLERHGGNLREVLMVLFDRYRDESRSSYRS